MGYATFLLVPLILLPAKLEAQENIDCKKDLKKAVELIDDMWSFKLFKPGAVDLQAAYKELESAAKMAKGPEACADVLRRLMAKLNDGHSHLGYYPGLERSRPYIMVRSQRERLSLVPGQLPKVHAYVVARDTLDSLLTAILPGSEILSVDGIPTDSIYERLQRRVSAATQQWRDHMCDYELLAGPKDTEAELVYRTPGGLTNTVNVRRPSADTLPDSLSGELGAWLGNWSLSRWKRLDGGWGYIRYTSFIHGSVRHTVERFDEYVDSLIDSPGLIIDLRGNSGGAVSARTQMAGRFVSGETPLTYLQIRHFGKDFVYELFDTRTMSPTTKLPLVVAPRTPIYRGPIVVLIDRGCFSACESFTGGLKSLGRVLVVGPERSGGGSGWLAGGKLPSGGTITFSATVGWLPNGEQIEANGVAPDIFVRERPRDWASGRDRVLERAIKALEEGKAPSIAAASSDG